MDAKEELANSIENIFKNTKRIHGDSDVIDWAKLAAHKTATFLEAKSKEEAQERYEEAKEFLDVDMSPIFPRPGIVLIETTESNLDKALKLAAFGKEE
jgi:hypothetical protein